MTTPALTERPTDLPQARPRFGTQQRTLSINGRLVLTDAIRAVGVPAKLLAFPDRVLALIGADAFYRMEYVLNQPYFIGSAVTITADEVCPTSGRVLIPIALREWAGLTPRSEVAIVDLGNHVLLMRWSQFEERRVEAAQALLEMLEAHA